MAQPDGQNEPSMEEILASIRRIISEDEKEQGEDAAPSAAPEADPEPVAEEAEDEDDEILDLTTRIDPEPGPEPEPQPEPEPEPEPAVEPEPASVLDPEPDFETAAFAEPAPEEEPAIEEPDFAEDVGEAPRPDDSDGLLSAASAAAAVAALSEVSRSLQGGGRGGEALPLGESQTTLEALVRQALKPLLKGWLDENLPPLVERIVRDEVRRLARRAEDE